MKAMVPLTDCGGCAVFAVLILGICITSDRFPSVMENGSWKTFTFRSVNLYNWPGLSVSTASPKVRRNAVCRVSSGPLLLI